MEPLAHASIGLMVKPAAPKAPLWALIAATQVPDLLSFGFTALGIEKPGSSNMDFNQGLQTFSPPYYPFSHGCFMCIVWSLLVAGIAFLFLKDLKPSLVIGSMVFSHWVLDFLVYSTLPLLFGTKNLVGLGLMNTKPGIFVSIFLEILFITAGITVYFISRKRTSISTDQK
jgi:hypothetical protein